MARLYSKSTILFIIISSSPVIWALFLNIRTAFSQWAQAPVNLTNKISFWSSDAMGPIFFMRHAQIDSTGPVFVLSKVLYNKALLFVDEILVFTSFLSPRLFFQSGDGTVFSPHGVDPIAFLLFPVWAYGLLCSIRDRKWLVIIGYVSFTLIAYLLGKREFSFLAPVLVFQMYFIYIGIHAIVKHKAARIYLAVSACYSFFLLGRLLLL